MTMTELKGKELGITRVRIEPGPVRVFAAAVKEDGDAFTGDGALVPPTLPFVMPYWGSMGEGGAAGLPSEELRGPGRMLLHGEQEFEFHRWPVTETAWTYADSGDPAVTARFTLVVRAPE